MPVHLVKISTFVIVLILKFYLALSHVKKGSKALDYGDNLLKQVEEYPEKNWLIKFYSPWCHQCHKLEPTFSNIAETIYHNHDHLIVGRIDCYKYPTTCDSFHVQSYPTILFLNKKSQTEYNGDRSYESLVDFARRMQGPDVNLLHTCSQFKRLTKEHEFVVILTTKNASTVLRKEFQALSKELKPKFWFYQIETACENIASSNSLLILKRFLERPIHFELDLERGHGVTSSNNLTASISEWIRRHSFPIYGEINRRNIAHVLSYSELLMMVVLDRYEPARKFMATSRQLHELYGNLSVNFAQDEQQRDQPITFAWTPDLDLISSIIIDKFPVPNFIAVRPDLSHYLLLKHHTGDGKQLPTKLRAESLRLTIKRLKLGELNFEGGSHLTAELQRAIFNYLRSLKSMYRNNALLTLLLIGLPSVILSFVIYTTCIAGAFRQNNEEEERAALLRRQAATNNHRKQD